MAVTKLVSRRASARRTPSAIRRLTPRFTSVPRILGRSLELASLVTRGRVVLSKTSAGSRTDYLVMPGRDTRHIPVRPIVHVASDD